MEQTSAAAFFCNQDIAQIDSKQFAALKRKAMQSSLRRARLCLHHKYNDKIQEMVIVFCKDSYVRPHRHKTESESIHAIEGNSLVVFFNEKGQVTRNIEMGPYASGLTFLYRLSKNLWHSIIPLTDFVITHETSAGPFIKEEVEFAPWSPEENDIKGIKVFLAKITKSCLTDGR